MTYKEKYMSANNFKELEDMVKVDTMYAVFTNHDRLKPIEDALNEVTKAKGWDYENPRKN